MPGRLPAVWGPLYKGVDTLPENVFEAEDIPPVKFVVFVEERLDWLLFVRIGYQSSIFDPVFGIIAVHG